LDILRSFALFVFVWALYVWALYLGFVFGLCMDFVCGV
jgi:hypothetical protein